MELTTAQIQIVKEYLARKNFNYIDLKDEILDHMISDIEHLQTKNITFENAFKMTILKWDKHFKETSSFFFGLQFSNFKIVMKKAVKQFKPYFFIYFASYILPVVFFKFIPTTFSKPVVNFTNGFLFSFSSVMLLYVAFIMIKVMQLKVKTTYSFILKTQYFGLILLIIGLLVGLFKENGEINPVFSGFVCCGYVIVFICHHFFKKHKEAIVKHQIS